jgi:hypothetical protein
MVKTGFQLQKVTLIVMFGKVQIVQKMAMTLCAIMILKYWRYKHTVHMQTNTKITKFCVLVKTYCKYVNQYKFWLNGSIWEVRYLNWYVRTEQREGVPITKVTSIVMFGKVQNVQKMAMTLCEITTWSTVGTKHTGHMQTKTQLTTFCFLINGNTYMRGKIFKLICTYRTERGLGFPWCGYD